VIHYILLRAIAHATEDRDRVLEALSLFLPQPLSGGEASLSVSPPEVETMEAAGHHGNPVVIYSATLKRKKEIKAFTDLLINGLSPDSRKLLLGELRERLDDELMLHLRFDKQQAYLGNIAFSESTDPIIVKMKIATYPKSREKAIEAMEELFGIP
jgi:hypothetical protein